MASLAITKHKPTEKESERHSTTGPSDWPASQPANITTAQLIVPPLCYGHFVKLFSSLSLTSQQQQQKTIVISAHRQLFFAPSFPLLFSVP